MSKVDDWLANASNRNATRPLIDMANGTEVFVSNLGDLTFYAAGEVVDIARDDIPAFVDWIIDVYDITPTGFERKGGA